LSYQPNAQGKNSVGKNLLKNLVRFSISGTVVRVSGRQRRGGQRDFDLMAEMSSRVATDIADKMIVSAPECR